MSISIIVVNYGVAELAARAVDSVIAQTKTRDFEIHLVDNASPGEDAETLRRMHEARGWGNKVTLWAEQENHGFGEGNNVVLRALAARETPPDFVFLLNPDAYLENDAVDKLASALEADASAAVAGAALMEAGGVPATAAFRFPGIVSEVSQLIDFGPISRLCKGSRVALPPDHAPGPVDWVSGAAVMFRFDAVRDEGFFDPDFFLYYEEVDLMRRLNESGWKILYVPSAQVLHLAGQATGVQWQKTERRRNPPYLYNSWRLYFSKSLGVGKARFLALLLFPAAVLNILLFRLRGRTPSLPAEFFRDHWHYVVRPLSGRRHIS